MRIDYAKKFLKQVAKLDNGIALALHDRILLFETNPYHPLLDNHALKGTRSGYRSINITGDWRALYTPLPDNAGVKFHIIGTHSQLYRS